MNSGRPVVAVIGGGFSGLLTAANLLADPSGPAVLLVERNAGLARGLAYGSAAPSHLLNVRAGNMSAFPDRPEHFLDWLKGQPGYADAGPAAFAPRAVYGRYLQSVLSDLIAGAADAGRLNITHDAVVDIGPDDDGLELELAVGRRLRVDAVVLAVGAAPTPRPTVPGLTHRVEPLFVPDPWGAGALDSIGADERILLLGSGLTMVDIALLLRERGHAGPIIALSRRGLAPRPHAEAPVPQVASPRINPAAPLSRQLRAVRERIEEVGDWRAVIDSLRPLTTAIWRAWSPEVRSRFLRHLRPWWDVHRHRMAPAVSDTVARAVRDHQLRVIGGRIVRLEPHRDGDRPAGLITYVERGSRTERGLLVHRIIPCMGMEGDVAGTRDPLLVRLLRRGLVRPHPLGLGLDVDTDSRALGEAAHPRLFALGPLTRGAFWESTAVPDLRRQAADVARSVSAALADAPPERRSEDTVVDAGVGR
jgi:uncharacterized NAD(P)/FAD-binding protein YdhS